jgi:DnaJ-class molecular chaperone
MDLVSLAAKFFLLALPCTEEDLKLAYKRAAKRFHPDMGGDPETFKQMRKAFDALIEAPEVLLVGSHTDKREKTIEGFLLNELGLGLGPTTNGRDCTNCDHKGYTTIHETVFLDCPKCEGHGDIMLCRDCAGTGLFTLKNKNQVKCRKCSGKGYWPCPKVEVPVSSYRGNPFGFGSIPRSVLKRHHGAMGCPDCKASGQCKVPTNRYRHYRCGNCNGTGEIKIYNPVIIKGSLGMTQKQRKRLETERSST